MTDDSQDPPQTVGNQLDQSSDQQSADGTVQFYAPVPTDVCYYEYVDESHVLTHESRDEISSPARTTRIEVVKRYESGFTREKFVLVPNSVHDIVWAIVIVILVGLTVTGIDQYGFSLTAPIALLGTILAGALLIVAGLFVRRALGRLWKVYHLRGIGRSTPLTPEEDHE